jgi:hypothetical protein
MALRLSKSDVGEPGAAGVGGAAGGGIAPHMQNLVGVTITSSSAKKLEALRKKEARKMARQTIKAPDEKERDAPLDSAKLEEQANLLKSWARDPNGKVSGDALPSVRRGCSLAGRRRAFPRVIACCD